MASDERLSWASVPRLRTVVKFDAFQVGTTLTNGQEVMPIQPRSRSPAPSLVLLPFLQTYYNLMLSAITRRSPRVGKHTGGNTDANRARQRGDPLLRSCRQSPNLDCFGMSPSPSVPAADSCNMEPGDRCMFLASSQGSGKAHAALPSEGAVQWTQENWHTSIRF